MSSTMLVKDGSNASKYLKTTGTGTTSDPFVTIHGFNEGELPKTAFGELSVAENSPKIQVMFPYNNINPRQLATTTTGTGSVSAANQLATVSTGASASSSAFLRTKDVLAYRTGQAIVARFTAKFTTGVANSRQLAGLFLDDKDGLQIGYIGTTFVVNRRKGGVDNTVTQTNFNADTLNSIGDSQFTIDPTQLNVFEITFQYLGAGEIQFKVENPNTGRFMVFHKIQYTNANPLPSMVNPAQFMGLFVENTTNSTDLVTSTASMGGFVAGKESGAGLVNAVSNLKTVSTEANVLSLHGKTTFNSIANMVTTQPVAITVATEGNGSNVINISVYLNTTLGGTPAYTDVDTATSTIEYDTAGTTITGGYKLFEFVVSRNGSSTQNITDIIPEMRPDDILTIAASSATSADVSVAITFKELF